MRPTLALAAIALAALALGAGCSRAPGPPDGDVVFSLLAVGDTGAVPDPETAPDQMAVARAMVHEDRRHPVDALVLLGDQFYPIGLRGEELVARVRENVVRPYCHFLDLSAPRSDEVDEACPPAEREHAVPVHVVLGNHDYMDKGADRVQREEVPEFVRNWRVSELAEVVQVAPQVSLVLIDTLSMALRPKRTEELREALAAAPGPWRVVAGHRPAARVDPEEMGEPRNAPLIQGLRTALREAGVPVHACLSGHEHNLQLLRGREGAPGLLVIAGGGSSKRGLLDDEDGRRFFGRQSLGFARVDLARRGAEERLVVSLFAVETGGAEPRRVARASVDAEGRLDEADEGR